MINAPPFEIIDISVDVGIICNEETKDFCQRFIDALRLQGFSSYLLGEKEMTAKLYVVLATDTFRPKKTYPNSILVLIDSISFRKEDGYETSFARLTSNAKNKDVELLAKSIYRVPCFIKDALTLKLLSDDYQKRFTIYDILYNKAGGRGFFMGFDVLYKEDVEESMRNEINSIPEDIMLEFKKAHTIAYAANDMTFIKYGREMSYPEQCLTYYNDAMGWDYYGDLTLEDFENPSETYRLALITLLEYLPTLKNNPKERIRKRGFNFSEKELDYLVNVHLEVLSGNTSILTRWVDY